MLSAEKGKIIHALELKGKSKKEFKDLLMELYSKAASYDLRGFDDLLPSLLHFSEHTCAELARFIATEYLKRVERNSFMFVLLLSIIGGKYEEFRRRMLEYFAEVRKWRKRKFSE